MAGEQDKAEWGDWEEEDMQTREKGTCPLCNGDVAEGNTANTILSHVLKEHGVDLVAFRTQQHLDEYQWIRLVNFLRKNARQEKPVSWEALGIAAGNPLFSDDSLLIPVLENDPLLSLLDDDDDDEDDMVNKTVSCNGGDNSEVARLKKEIEELREQNAMLRAAAKSMIEEGVFVRRDSAAASAAAAASDSESDKDSDDDSDKEDDKGVGSTVEENDTDPYFASYARMGIHEEMLKDAVRTGAYEEWAKRAGACGYMKGKTVLDVGAGTGILSMFAAREGAGKVIAVEASSTSQLAKRIIAANGYSDRISIIPHMVEEPVTDRTVREITGGEKKVDIIVSEWMGYALLYENMLDAVVHARDKWLAPDGIVEPSHALLYVAGLECSEAYNQRASFFTGKPYGMDLSIVERPAFAEASVEVIDPETIAAGPVMLEEIDIRTVPAHAFADKTYSITMPVNRDVSAIHCICIYFDCDFRMPHNEAEKVVLSTAPQNTPTHWKQSVLYFTKPLPACPAGSTITGKLRFVMCSSGPHDLNCEIELRSSANPQQSFAETFHL